MTVTKDDFEKVWASQSPLTPYSFSDAQYKEGWNFVGATPPSRQMWDAFMQNADEKLKYLYQHEDVPLGHEYFTFNPNVPQGSLPLFGGEYDRATYSDLWNWVQEQTGYLKTEAEWQTLATANNGNVPYYSDGDGSTTFRVPSLKCWVKSANGTVSEVGSYLQAGLPNIVGSSEQQTLTDGGGGLSNRVITATDALYADGNITTSWNTSVQSGTSRTIHQLLNFDASRSNSIYGNSTTVQPPSIVGMWLVKAYGVIVDTGQIDEQQYLDDRMADLKNVYLPANYTDTEALNSEFPRRYNAYSGTSAGTTLTVPGGQYLVIVSSLGSSVPTQAHFVGLLGVGLSVGSVEIKKGTNYSGLGLTFTKSGDNGVISVVSQYTYISALKLL